MFKLIKQIFRSFGLLGDVAERLNDEAEKLIAQPDWFGTDQPPKQPK